jgi:ubiquitin-protein ligase
MYLYPAAISIHRESITVTRLARLSAKSNCLLGCHAALRFWLALEDTTHIHISYYSSPAKHKSTTTYSHTPHAEFRYSITHIESFQISSSSHKNKAPPAFSELSRTAPGDLRYSNTTPGHSPSQHLHTSTMSAPSSQGSKAAAPASGNVIKRYAQPVLEPTIPPNRHLTIPLSHSLQSELMALMTSPTPGISAFPTADLTHWNATLLGPADTPYDSLSFKLTLAFPADYPYAPPEVLFKTPIYHPNVDMSGRICLDILKPAGQGKEGAWSAALNTESVLLSIQSLLGEPNK